MPQTIGFVGFGEIGFSWAQKLIAAGVPPAQIRLYYKFRGDEAKGKRARERAEQTGVLFCDDSQRFAAGLSIVFSAVSPGSALSIAEELMPLLPAGALYVDVNSCRTAVKQQMAGLAESHNVRMVDVALVGAPGDLLILLACGPGARDFAATVDPLQFKVQVADGPAGTAAMVKMLRSVFMKGAAALLIECLQAAAAYGVAGEVVGTLVDAMDSQSFAAWVDRFVCGTLEHAGRRVEELDGVLETLAEVGVPPVMSGATRQLLAQVAGLSGPWHENPARDYREGIAWLLRANSKPVEQAVPAVEESA